MVAKTVKIPLYSRVNKPREHLLRKSESNLLIQSYLRRSGNQLGIKHQSEMQPNDFFHIWMGFVPFFGTYEKWFFAIFLCHILQSCFLINGPYVHALTEIPHGVDSRHGAKPAVSLQVAFHKFAQSAENT